MVSSLWKASEMSGFLLSNLNNQKGYGFLAIPFLKFGKCRFKTLKPDPLT